MAPRKLRHTRSLNIFVTDELKEAIELFARSRDVTLAAVVRQAIALGLPILEKCREAEDRIATHNNSQAVGDALVNTKMAQPVA